MKTKAVQAANTFIFVHALIGAVVLQSLPYQQYGWFPYIAVAVVHVCGSFGIYAHVQLRERKKRQWK